MNQKENTILFSGEEVQHTFCFFRKPLNRLTLPYYSKEFNVIKYEKYKRFK
jgi:hypothetical protein